MVKVYDNHDSTIRTLELLDSHIANFKGILPTANGYLDGQSTNNHVDLVFQSASQTINRGVAKNAFGRWITNPFGTDGHKSPVKAMGATKNPEITKGCSTKR